MQRITPCKHRGKRCLRYYVNGRARYWVLKSDDVEAEIFALRKLLEAGGGRLPRKKLLAPKPEGRTLAQLIEQFGGVRDSIPGKRKNGHTGTMRAHLTRLFEAASIRDPHQITETKIVIATAKLRRPRRKPGKPEPGDKPEEELSIATRTKFRRHAKMFTAWLVDEGVLSIDPLAKVQCPKPKEDEEALPRGRFYAHQVEQLTTHADAAEPIEGLLGPDRALTYGLGFYAGLRRGEQASLTPESFDLGDQPFVSCKGNSTKNGRRAKIPLHPSLLPRVKAKLATFGPGELLFPNLRDKDCARMIQLDCEACGIAVDTPNGRLTFHSLRHGFVSGLLDSGCDIKTVQKLARHADPATTLRYYHALPDAEWQAISKLPGLPT